MLEKKDLDLEKAVLVGIITKAQNDAQSKEYLDELEFLTYTAVGVVVKRFTQKMEMPNPSITVQKSGANIKHMYL